jgi:hypothetical protein
MLNILVLESFRFRFLTILYKSIYLPVNGVVGLIDKILVVPLNLEESIYDPSFKSFLSFKEFELNNLILCSEVFGYIMG